MSYPSPGFDGTNAPWSQTLETAVYDDLLSKRSVTNAFAPGWEQALTAVDLQSSPIPGPPLLTLTDEAGTFPLWGDGTVADLTGSVDMSSSQFLTSEAYQLAKDYADERSAMLSANADLMTIREKLNAFADALEATTTIDPALLTNRSALIYENDEQDPKAQNIFTRYRTKYDQYLARGVSTLRSAAMLFREQPDTSVTDVLYPNVFATLPPDANPAAKTHRQISEEILAVMAGETHDPLALAKLNNEFVIKSNRFHQQGKQVAERYGWIWDASNPSSTPLVRSAVAFSLD